MKWNISVLLVRTLRQTLFRVQSPTSWNKAPPSLQGNFLLSQGMVLVNCPVYRSRSVKGSYYCGLNKTNTYQTSATHAILWLEPWSPVLTATSSNFLFPSLSLTATLHEQAKLTVFLLWTSGDFVHTAHTGIFNIWSWPFISFSVTSLSKYRQTGVREESRREITNCFLEPFSFLLMPTEKPLSISGRLLSRPNTLPARTATQLLHAQYRFSTNLRCQRKPPSNSGSFDTYYWKIKHYFKNCDNNFIPKQGGIYVRKQKESVLCVLKKLEDNLYANIMAP